MSAAAAPRVVVVAEYYPRRDDPALGIWAHRQALAARDHGADVRVVVLHRLVPPRAALRSRSPATLGRALSAPLRQPRRATLDGLQLTYVPFVSPPRPRSYETWGRWAAPGLKRTLARLERECPIDLVHAHYAVPAADAVRRARPDLPLLVSVHGGDVLHVVRRGARAAAVVRDAFAHARLVACNSAGTERLSREAGATATRVVHLGADLPQPPPMPQREPPLVVSLGSLIARKRHADLLRAVAAIGDVEAGVRIVGDGPERPRLDALARELGIADRVELTGALPHAAALAAIAGGTVFALPSTEEAFGVATIEAMAAGIPAIGCAGEPGPEEIAAAGAGIVLVPPGDLPALTAALRRLLLDPVERDRLGAAARATVEQHFTWDRCGAQTRAIYDEILR